MAQRPTSASQFEPPRRRILARFGSWILIVLGALLMLGVFVPSEDSASESGGVGVAIMATLLAAGGISLLLRARKIERQQLEEFEDRSVIATAAEHDGVISIAQVAIDTRLSMRAAESTLARLSARNIAQPELMDDGSVLYRFAALRRRSSTGPDGSGAIEFR